jgi:hypothetical protein
MDGVKVAWSGWLAAHRFLFWALVAMVTRWGVVLLHVIDWHKEASREMLVLNPRRPKDLYDAGYSLFAYDINVDAWIGHWRSPNALPGTLAAETYAWRETWSGIPFHEVEFSEMPEVTFKVRAVELAWCRKNLKVGEGQALMASVIPQIDKAVKEAEARAAHEAKLVQAEELTAQEAPAPKVVH